MRALELLDQSADQIWNA